ncbi:hypothetical protein EGQ49_07630 [Campylobacter upsaliensis]|nr:hypothetical protein [Campylobacter upsaliensis]EAH6029699.1 hypothetical protein [Campylobacter upsaliensis]EAL9781655.1 hypothetical protein [Campylobacter upsaliensis]
MPIIRGVGYSRTYHTSFSRYYHLIYSLKTPPSPLKKLFLHFILQICKIKKGLKTQNSLSFLRL